MKRIALLLWVLIAGSVHADDPRLEFFEKRIRPLLVDHCFTCHSAETKPSGGLRVDDRGGLLAGGNSGPAIVPGDPAGSLLLKRVTLPDLKRRMPIEGKHLSEAQVADLTTWIKDGAAWPPVAVPASVANPKPEYEPLRRTHWAWQPCRSPTPPAVRDRSWPLSDLDRFVQAKREEANLQPSGDADRGTLIRRLSFDLTGLPPTPEQIHEFLSDESADALARLVDRLLASPAFGERWGRHWLDVARYGESTGPSRNIPYPHAWRYRDWVIDALNADKPYDRFLTEQLAGDLLPAADEAERNSLLIATGFLALGVKDVNQRFNVRFIMDNVDEQIDVVTRSVLALTVSCARCHDHKFDPIPQTDYYALAGIFTSTDNCAGVRNKMGGGGLDYYDPAMLVRLSGDLPPPPAQQYEKLKAELAEAKAAWDKIRGTPEGLAKAADGFPVQRPYRLKVERLTAELAALTDPAARGLAVHGVREAKIVRDTELRVRGEAEKLGPVVPRGFLTAFPVPGAPTINPTQSGRRELAAWLTSPANPLTARVAVNRVWQNLFGQGLVPSVDNFGVTGDRPSHPELLDYLAEQFLRDGWSLKRLIRSLVLTRTYQLSAESMESNQAVDPANRLLWRHVPRRLSAEEMRDAVLVAAGTLDSRRPEASPTRELKMIEMRDNGPEARTIETKADRGFYRSVYLPLVRGVTPRALEAFDPVDQTLVSGSRETTTVPAQSLFLLNSAFLRHQALALADQLLAQPGDEAARIALAYRRTLGRTPTAAEIERALAFLADYEAQANELLTFTPPQPMKPADPDAIDPPGDRAVQPTNARSAAWMALTQALFASAEFRFVR